ncbi:hypothetical protein [Ornithinimicrobium sp. W1665]|uniref:hypothetical protein n=1 Tax=Ornithinimicrobium sp. W1665 TaxID=3416666 RepID=UPI003D6B3803
MISATNAGQPSSGAAHAILCAQYGLPGPSPSRTQMLYASPARVTESRLAAHSSHPTRCPGCRDTMSAPINAHPRLANGVNGQPWSAQVASLSSDRWAAVNIVSRMIATTAMPTNAQANRTLTSTPPGAGRARWVPRLSTPHMALVP